MTQKWLYQFLKLGVVCFFAAGIGGSTAFLGEYLDIYILRIIGFFIAAISIISGMAIVGTGIIRIIFSMFFGDGP